MMLPSNKDGLSTCIKCKIGMLNSYLPKHYLLKYNILFGLILTITTDSKIYGGWIG